MLAQAVNCRGQVAGDADGHAALLERRDQLFGGLAVDGEQQNARWHQ